MEENYTIIDLLSEKPINYDRINSYLSKIALPPTPQEKILEEWSLKNSKGQTLFEIACELNDEKIIELLLEWDFPIPSDYSSKALSDEIISLLRTRGEWQREAQSGEDGICFNRACTLVNMSFVHSKAEEGEAVLVMGQTGVGKSTLTNFVKGVDYYKKGVKMYKKNEINNEVAKVGITTRSETLFPKAYPLDRTNQNKTLWVDMPGVEDNQSNLFEIASAVGTKILTESAKKIKGIFLACSWSHFEDPKLLEYRKVAANLGKILNANESLSQHITLLVTKPPKELTIENITESLKKLWDDELKFIKEDPTSIDASYQKKIAVKNVTKILLQDGTVAPKIVIVDVTEAAHRENVINAINAFPGAKDQREFNFKSYHALVERFKDKVNFFYKKYDFISGKVKELQGELLVRANKKNSVEERLKKHIVARDKWNIKKEKLLKGADIEERIYVQLCTEKRMNAEVAKAKVNVERLSKQKELLDQSSEKINRHHKTLGDLDHPSVKGFSAHKNAKDKNTVLLISVDSLADTLSDSMKIAEKIYCDKLIKLNDCKEKIKILKEEKVEIEAIKEQFDENIDEHIVKENELIQLAESEQKELIKDFKETEFSLQNYLVDLKVNEGFFKKLNLLCVNLDIKPQADINVSSEYGAYVTDMKKQGQHAFFPHSKYEKSPIIRHARQDFNEQTVNAGPK